MRPGKNGNLLVVSTGLDMVFEIDSDDNIANEWCVAKDSGWNRFSRMEDYRRIATTKPHKSHPNYVFELKGELWATRFMQRDAVCVTDPARSFKIADESTPDGEVQGERLYFTTVDGHVVVIDASTQEVHEDHDLNRIEGTDYPLGWCRGISVTGEHEVVVGYSRIRPTRFRENIRWIRHRFGVKTGALRPSRIAAYDLESETRKWEVVLEDHGVNAIFSVIPI